MSSEVAVEARGLGKAYPIYRRPQDRLKQLLWGRRHRYYEEFWAVRNVDLSVRRGETVGIVGANGSGKSTLLQMICGTLKPTEGEVNLHGRVAAMLALGSGFNPEFTGRENVHLGASVLGLSAAETAARFETIAAFADIGAFMDQPLKRYSSGMHARLAFALCANVDADVLVIDEILSVGDAAFQQKCMRFLNRFRMRGTLLFVSHDSGAVVKLCDRALWLERGQVRGFGTAKEISRLYLAAQAEERVDDTTAFQLGGRVQPLSQKPPPDTVVTLSDATPASETETLLFDPEDTANKPDGAEILSVALYDDDGGCLHLAGGGESVELRVSCRALRKLIHPVVAFVVRDRLGQIIFSDNSLLSPTVAPAVEAGQSFAAVFAFLLPYLASGVYALQAFLFGGVAPYRKLLAERRDRDFLNVHSRHLSDGLANVAMRSVSIGIAPMISGSGAPSTEYSRTPLRAAE
jgi:lipopolysaccharide transport system ATP-binding protein